MLDRPFRSCSRKLLAAPKTRIPRSAFIRYTATLLERSLPQSRMWEVHLTFLTAEVAHASGPRIVIRQGGPCTN